MLGLWMGVLDAGWVVERIRNRVIFGRRLIDGRWGGWIGGGMGFLGGIVGWVGCVEGVEGDIAICGDVVACYIVDDLAIHALVSAVAWG
jgi:hypothetical protein